MLSVSTLPKKEFPRGLQGKKPPVSHHKAALHGRPTLEWRMVDLKGAQIFFLHILIREITQLLFRVREIQSDKFHSVHCVELSSLGRKREEQGTHLTTVRKPISPNSGQLFYPFDLHRSSDPYQLLSGWLKSSPVCSPYLHVFYLAPHPLRRYPENLQNRYSLFVVYGI